jgi:hypothetical protein
MSLLGDSIKLCDARQGLVICVADRDNTAQLLTSDGAYTNMRREVFVAITFQNAVLAKDIAAALRPAEL